MLDMIILYNYRLQQRIPIRGVQIEINQKRIVAMKIPQMEMIGGQKL